MASASTMVSGLNGLLAVTAARVSTFGPSEVAFTPAASKSTVT